MIGWLVDEVDSFRDPQVVEAERAQRERNSILRRVMESGFGIADRMMQASEFATMNQYANKMNDRAMQDSIRLDSLRSNAREMESESIENKRVEQARLVERSIKSPSATEFDMDYGF